MIRAGTLRHLNELVRRAQTSAKTAKVAVADFNTCVTELRELYFTNATMVSLCREIGADPRLLLRAPAKLVKKAPTKKAAKKNKAKKNTPKKSREAAVARATKGRRAVASGERPPLKEAIVAVMGATTMNVGDVIKALDKKGWLPDSEEIRNYISFALSSNKETFERVTRGVYKVRAGVTFDRTKKAAKKSKRRR